MYIMLGTLDVCPVCLGLCTVISTQHLFGPAAASGTMPHIHCAVSRLQCRCCWQHGQCCTAWLSTFIVCWCIAIRAGCRPVNHLLTVGVLSAARAVAKQLLICIAELVSSQLTTAVRSRAADTSASRTASCSCRIEQSHTLVGARFCEPQVAVCSCIEWGYGSHFLFLHASLCPLPK